MGFSSFFLDQVGSQLSSRVETRVSFQFLVLDFCTHTNLVPFCLLVVLDSVFVLAQFSFHVPYSTPRRGDEIISCFPSLVYYFSFDVIDSQRQFNPSFCYVFQPCVLFYVLCFRSVFPFLFDVESQLRFDVLYLSRLRQFRSTSLFFIFA